MRKLSLLPVTLDGRRYWEVTVPLRPVGRKQVRFKSKVDAEKYFRACKVELRRTGRVDLLSHRQSIVDAIEALRMLKGVKDRKKLRHAAALLLEAEAAIGKLRGEVPAAPYTEPASRAVELSPGLYAILTGLARRKGMSLYDLVSGMLQRYVKEAAPSPDEKEVRRMRDCLQAAA
jgi:hypothetical protein